MPCARKGQILLCKKQSDSTKKFSEADIINMLEFLIDNIFAMFDGRVFQQTVGIHMGTNCRPLLADLFLYSYETDFMQGLLKKSEKKLTQSSNFTFRFIDDVLSLNNYIFGNFVDCIFPTVVEIKDVTATDKSASYLEKGRLRTKSSDK